jgi:hypothetical protein
MIGCDVLTIEELAEKRIADLAFEFCFCFSLGVNMKFA